MLFFLETNKVIENQPRDTGGFLSFRPHSKQIGDEHTTFLTGSNKGKVIAHVNVFFPHLPVDKQGKELT